MKLRYMIDMILSQDEGGQPMYEPVGVWVQGPGPGLDIEMYYIDSRAQRVRERKEEAEWVINRLVEINAQSLPEDFLEYHQQTRSPYSGAFTEINHSEQDPNLEKYTKCFLKLMNKERRHYSG